MREYETIYILKPDLPTEQLAALKDKFDNAVTKGKGHILSHADWGKRKLAYRVHNFRKAHYMYLQFLAEGLLVSELERLLKYEDNVLKFLTVKLDDDVVVEDRLAQQRPAPPPPDELGGRREYEGSAPRRGSHEGGRSAFREKEESPGEATETSERGAQSGNKEE